ncbi:YbaB/EbfC family nucleoid-associated protein [Cryptosporangium aurantiacum]|uniref:Conserved DNA-binding protein YbaB n=1 Tax=Cryptosporangium aurantiacum TaxID=134849 RepID=A0A1M7NHU0_9ACTN|nr:YbaB/EbfC family nucleoid-associated protein [Cryptosporangium aurantiacum]SHN03279.1 Conserved DNA-binding protein YbaB [Cryptosporangium aurantiacum]
MDPRGLQARADELMEEFHRLRDGVGELQQQLRTIEVVVHSDDRLVTATLGPRGQLVRLELDPRIYRDPNSRELASKITDTIQKGARQVADRTLELCRPFLPEDDVRTQLDGDLDTFFTRLDNDIFGGDAFR